MSTASSASAREQLVALARAKPVTPYTLDEQLTFFCPRENLAGLDLPVVSAFHRWQLQEHRPRRDEPAVLLLLPCQRIKPYTLSPQHQAVNRVLLAAGYQPENRGDWPTELAGKAPAALLSNSALRGHGVRIDRAVISEPFGLVPYEAIYRWRGSLSPAGRYDDPGLFEHRGIACSWRADCGSVTGPSGKPRWGDVEREAYVTVHNRLVDLIATVLERWQPAYETILAYAAPGLTHRSFLGTPAERRAANLPNSREVHGRRLALDSVAQRLPGAVRIVPDGAEMQALRTARGGRLPADLLTGEDSLTLLLREIERVV